MSVGGAIQDGGSWWAEDGLGRFIETGDSVGRRVLCLVMTVVLKGERGDVQLFSVHLMCLFRC